VFGPGAAIIVRRPAMLGRAGCRASAARRVNTREKTIAVLSGVIISVFVGLVGVWGVAEEKSVKQDKQI
jgi:hypothetical protein